MGDAVLAPDTCQILEDVVLHAWNESLRDLQAGARSLSMDSSVAAIRVAMEQTLRRCAAQHNAKQAITAVPNEVLSSIFDHAPIASRINIARTCKNWSDVMFSSPRIWTSIVYDKHPNPVRAQVACRTFSGFQRLLHLSSKCLLKLDVTISAGGAASQFVLELLLKHLARCRRLRIIVWLDGGILPKVQDALTKLLSSGAPALRHFSLWDYADMVNRGDHTEFQLFANDAPMLDDILLRCNITAIEHSIGALSEVRRVLISPPPPFDRISLSKTIALFGRAKELRLNVTRWSDEVESPQWSTIDLPATMKSLEISTAVFKESVRILRNLRWKGVPTVALLGYTDDMNPDVHAHSEAFEYLCEIFDPVGLSQNQTRFSVRTVSISWGMTNLTPNGIRSPNIHVFSSTDPMGVLLPMNVSETPIRMISGERQFFYYCGRFHQAVFAYTARLYLHEIVFDAEALRHRMPELPNLLHLVVWMMPLEFHVEPFATSPFIMLDGLHEALVKLECPHLQTLTLAACHKEWTIDTAARLETRSVTAFVQRCLQYDAPTLQLLAVHGIDMVVLHAEDLEALICLAESVQWDERYFSWDVNNVPEEVTEWI
ncbi:hypothetical protein BKA62DRAFT_699222 [Auriculariales sp. MPI-PUGE-AT-0066]|nr:hypothetical protein BKA62DRAFT_699222 [Auriculariales sp. MPI-PUGE-AT-0066]